ncbi:unnamed protein product [Chrysoparadoxa australica]
MGHEPSFTQSFISGGLTGMVSKTVMAPIERVKLLLQTQHASGQIAADQRYSGLINCFVRVYREQGAMSFWRGNTVNVVRYIPSQAMNFALRDKFMHYMLGGVSIEKDFWRYTRNSFIAGGATGGVSLLVLYPFDFARTRVGTDVGSGVHRQYRGSLDCLKQTLIKEGPRAVYRGFDIALVGIVSWRAFYFGGYDTFAKLVLGDRKGGTVAERFAVAQTVTTLAGSAVYPLDSIRRRMMMQAGRKEVMYKNSLHCVRRILAEEGYRGFYRGLSANLLRSVGGSLSLVLFDEIQGILHPQ